MTPNFCKSTDIGLTLVYCWPIVYDAGPTVNQRWANVLCLQAVDVYIWPTYLDRAKYLLVVPI